MLFAMSKPKMSDGSGQPGDGGLPTYFEYCFHPTYRPTAHRHGHAPTSRRLSSKLGWCRTRPAAQPQRTLLHVHYRPFHTT
ncbi:hypothetical protein ACJQWK_09902 [Exserohilum turcicum]